MKLSEKILQLRRARGLSQEELAERLEVSRQAISRWEMGTAMPDAANILQLSRLFGVSTDYLLYEEYQSPADPAAAQFTEDTARAAQNRRTAFLVVTELQVIVLILQIICTFILQQPLFSFGATALSVAVLIGFELGWHRPQPPVPEAARYRRRFYTLSVWMMLYFPLRWICCDLSSLIPRPYSSLLLEAAILLLYLILAAVISTILRKKL